MRIKIHNDEHKFTIFLPNPMLFNRLTRFIAIKLLKKHSPVAFTESQLKILFRSVRKSKRALCGRPLISVKSADKEEVEIHL